MGQELTKSLLLHQKAFGIDLSPDDLSQLNTYYKLLLEHNDILHLVAPCGPDEFATRHILESLTMLAYLPQKAKFVDIGSGGGLPAIPCLIVRRDLRALLIESKEKKVGFLRTVFAECELTGRAEAAAKQFSEVTRPRESFISCRALDKFTEKLPQLIKWSGNCPRLFFGGPSLETKLVSEGKRFEKQLMPMSDQRYLFIIR